VATLVSEVDPKINLLVDPKTRSPRTDEYSIGVDREIGGRLSASVAYVHKTGGDYIGWKIVLPQGNRRILLEPRGSRRLSSQSLLDVRLSKTILSRESARIELLVDVLNVLNDNDEEELATDDLYTT